MFCQSSCIYCRGSAYAVGPENRWCHVVRFSSWQHPFFLPLFFRVFLKKWGGFYTAWRPWLELFLILFSDLKKKKEKVTVEGFISFTSSSNDPFVCTLLLSLSVSQQVHIAHFVHPACGFVSLKWKKKPNQTTNPNLQPTLSSFLDALSHKSYQSYMSYSLSLPLSFWSRCGTLLYKISLHYREKRFFPSLFF